MATTWDAGNTDSHVILSNGNLTAANDYPLSNGSWGLSRSTTTKTSGKFMIEFSLTPNPWATIGNFLPMNVGLGISSQVLNNFSGSSSNSFGYFLNDGTTRINGSTISTNFIGNWAGSDIGDMAFDFGNQKFWVRRNGGGWFGAAIGSQDPANNIGGVSFSTVSAGAKYAMVSGNDGGGIGLSGSLTFKFSTAPTYALPSGYNMWDPLVSGTVLPLPWMQTSGGMQDLTGGMRN